MLFELFSGGLIVVPNCCFVFIEVETNLREIPLNVVHGFSEVFWVDYDVHVIHVCENFGFCVHLGHGVVGVVDGLMEGVNKT